MDQVLLNAMENLDEGTVLARVEELLETEDLCAVQHMLNQGIRRVGDRFERGEYFLADLVVAGMIYRSTMDLFRGHLGSAQTASLGRVVIGVAENDIHDIGKDIICELLRIEGFEVIDLGVDVSSAAFVEAVRIHSPDILAMSGVMRFSLDAFQKTLTALGEAGLRRQLAVVIGGSCIVSGCAALMGADAEAIDPDDTVHFCREVMEKKHGTI